MTLDVGDLLGNKNSLELHSSGGEGQKIRIDPDDSDAILKVFNIVSGVIHGKKFDALQIFNASVPFLKLTEKYIEKGVEWGVV